MTNRQRMAKHLAYREEVLKARNCRRLGRHFKKEHNLTDEEFACDEYQVLFAIQYPEAF